MRNRNKIEFLSVKTFLATLYTVYNFKISGHTGTIMIFSIHYTILMHRLSYASHVSHTCTIRFMHSAIYSNIQVQYLYCSQDQHTTAFLSEAPSYRYAQWTLNIFFRLDARLEKNLMPHMAACAVEKIAHTSYKLHKKAKKVQSTAPWSQQCCIEAQDKMSDKI